MIRRLSLALTLIVALIALQTNRAFTAQDQPLMTIHTRGSAQSVGRLPATAPMHLDIVLPLRHQAELEDFLKEVYDPSSPSYRHFLTVQQFTAKFGPTRKNYDAVIRFAKAHGFTVVGGSRDGMDVQVAGSVATVEAAFHVAINLYMHPTESRTFYAPDQEPTADLPFRLWHISGLDNYSIPHSAAIRRNLTVKSNAVSGSCPSSSYCGSDMRSAYYGGTALTGSGQSLGLLEFDGYDLADVNTYFTNAGQTNAVPIVGISTDGTSLSCLHSSGCDDTEQTLDITQAVSMAPGLTALNVFVGSSDTAILSAMSTHTPLAAQLSSSWTWSPADPGTDDPYFEKFAAQGQAYFQAAGDSGAYTTRSQDVFPADDAHVTAVGGTDLQIADGAWNSETVWADGGGGFFMPDGVAIPSWQQLSGVITAANKGSTTLRNSPDVAAEANFDFYVCANQTTCTANEYGGTSFAAPMWAAYMALVNQQAIANGNAALGFLNPIIYALGLGSTYSSDFHDIVSGTNGFAAVTGYDLATGWGSPNGSGLINSLAALPSAPDLTISASPTALSVVQGASGGSTITTAVSGGLNSAVALTATGQPAGVSVTFSPSSIAAPGSGSAAMSIAVSSTAAPGTYPITVTGAGGGITPSPSAVVTLTVTAPVPPDFTINASPNRLTVSTGSSGTSTLTTAVAGGFSSAISLSPSGLGSGQTLSFSPTALAAPGSGTSRITIKVSASGKAGTNNITITATGGGKTHTATIALTVRRGFL